MKKAIGIILFIIFFGVGTADAAVFTKNLYFGLEKDSEVMKLQELLTSEGVYSGPITGNFYSLTLNGVKAFQNKYGITPVGGFFGPLTRGKANTIIDSQLSDSESQAIMETGSPTPTSQADPTQLQLSALLAQLELLQKQLNAQQQAAQGTQNSPTNTTTTQPPTTPIVLPNNPQPTPTPATPQATPSLDPLVFTETPKLVFRQVTEGTFGLSYITWKTNRPSTLVISPVFPDASGWTTAGGAWESCGRAGVSHDINSTCKIKVKDSSGLTAEATITVFGDSIDL